jgi:membrane protein
MIRELWDLYFREKISDKSAALSFYLLLTFPAVLLGMIYVSKIFVPEQKVNSLIISWSEFLAIGQVSYFIESFTTQNITISVLALLLILFLATKGFAYLYESINSIWGTHWLSAQWHKRIIASIILLIITSFLAITFLIDSVLTKAIISFRQIYSFSAEFTFFIYTAATFIMLILLVGSLYKLLIDTHIKNRHILLVSIIITLLFLVSKQAFGFFISFGQVASVYGTLGLFVVLLTWTYFQAKIFYLGALMLKILHRRR